MAGGFTANLFFFIFHHFYHNFFLTHKIINMKSKLVTAADYPVRPYTYKELMVLYGISRRTLTAWLAPFRSEIGEKRGRYLTVMQVAVIFKRLGYPMELDEVGG